MVQLPRTWLAIAVLALAPVSSAQSSGPIQGASQSAGKLGAASARAANLHPVANGTWTLAGSPYVLKLDTFVGNLTIEAGVEVRAKPGVELVVRGQLIAVGTPVAPIVFRSANALKPWDGLRFDRATGSSVLDSCQVEGSQSSGIEILNSAVSLKNCEVFNNTSSATGGGVSAVIDNGDLVLENCLLFSNTAAFGGGGIAAQIPNGQLVLDGCSVLDNVVNPDLAYNWARGGGGVRCTDSLSLYITGSTISGNTVWAWSGSFSSAEGGGVWVQNTPLTLTLSVIEYNVLDSGCNGGYCNGGAYGGGLYVKDSVASMTLCVVRENDIHGWVQPYAGFNKESADAQGGGVYVTNTDQVFEGTNCVIAGNTAKATGKWNGVYGAGLNFTGRDLGSDLNLTNCVVARNLAVDGGWYAGGGGPVHAGVMVSYPSPALGTYQGGNGVIQNTIASENLGCHINWSTPTICAALVQPSLDHPSWVTSPVNYSIGQSSVLTGVGNIDLEPEFVGTGTTLHDLAIASSSAAVDAGNPALAFDDVAFPPSLGGTRNDMGVNGGPLAGGWALLPSGP